MELVGREEFINEITQKIMLSCTSHYPVLLSSINGMPAVGKTSLAVFLAYKFQYLFPDAQLYIDCFGYTAGHAPLTEEEILDSIFYSLETPIDTIPHIFSQKVVLMRSLLSKLRSIIIFDNINSAEQIKNILPGNNSTLVLITSRNRSLNIPNVYPVTLDLLDEESSVTLLRNISGLNGQNYIPLLKDVARKCGYLPLALQIIARRMRGRSNLGFIYRFVESSSQLKTMTSKKYEQNEVFESFNISYDMLNGMEKETLQLMAIVPCPEVTSEICSKSMGISEEDSIATLENLFDERLIEEIGGDRFRLHDLMRDFARIKNEEQALKGSEWIDNLASYFENNVKDICKQLYPYDQLFFSTTKFGDFVSETDRVQLLTWINRERNNIISFIEYYDTKNDYLQYIHYLHTLIPYIRRSISSSAAIRFEKKALEYANSIKDEILIAECETYLAIILEQASEFEQAAYYYDIAEAKWSKIGNLVALAYVLSNFGFNLERLGDYERALQKLEKALKIYEDKRNQYGEGFALSAIGAVFWRKKEYYHAKQYFERALSIRKQVDDQLGISSTTNNLGFTYLKLDNPTEAKKLFDKSLSISSKYNDYHGQSVTTNNLGYYNIYLNNYKDALINALDARKLAESVGDAYQIGRSYDVEAKALIGIKDYDNAIVALHNAIEIFERINVPEQHEDEMILQCIYSNNQR